MRVLVAFGSKRGGTEELAQWLGASLRGEGFEVEVRPAAEAGDVGAYDAVVVGGALYAGRWHRDARRFVRRHARELATRPTWLFSSGPLDDPAIEAEIPPIGMVRNLMSRAGARGHATFGGRLAPDSRGFMAWRMARSRAGDWRDIDRVERWAAQLAAELRRDEETARIA